MRLFFQLNWKSIHLQVKGRRKKNSCRHDRKQGGGGVHLLPATKKILITVKESEYIQHKNKYFIFKNVIPQLMEFLNLP